MKLRPRKKLAYLRQATLLDLWTIVNYLQETRKDAALGTGTSEDSVFWDCLSDIIKSRKEELLYVYSLKQKSPPADETFREHKQGDPNLIGYFVFKRRTGSLEIFEILKSRRFAGWGRQMLQAIENNLVLKSRGSLSCRVLPWAHDFWLKMGFQPVDQARLHDPACQWRRRTEVSPISR